MSKKCLYCYLEVEDNQDFHKDCAKTFFGNSTPPKIEYSLNQMNELANQVIKQSITVPGVQPKLSMSSIFDQSNQHTSRLTVVGALGGNYILKPPTERFPQMIENEHVSMRIAESFGIKVVPSSLIRLSSGELCYITKRIDRTESGQKKHMIDMFQATEAFDKYRSSLEKVGKAIGKYSSNTLLDKLFFFDLVLFSFLIGNNDMHLKNFSMIESKSGWILAPAYDLLNVSIILPEDKEELALTLSGKKKKIKLDHFEQLGVDLKLTPKQIKSTFNRMIKNKPKAKTWIERSFLSNELKESYVKLIDERYRRLSLS